MNWDGLTPNSFWYDSHRLLFNKDSRLMAELPDEYIQMVVTSPPYWGLRKYAGLPDLIWGGKEDCQHIWIDSSLPQSGGVGDYEVGRVGNALARTGSHEAKISNTCSLCGAWKGQLGLEPEPEMYISHLISIFREIRRVLRKDGVVFLNIGDSYYNDTRGGIRPPSKSSIVKDSRYDEPIRVAGKSKVKQRLLTTCPICLTDTYAEKCCGIDLTHSLNTSNTLKPKDLCLIPFRLAIALQEDGWWVRSVIIWAKPNPMPESVTDRPTESHEYVLMLTKAARYYYDQEAVRESNSPDTHPYIAGGGFYKEDAYRKDISDTGQAKRMPVYQNPTGRNLRSVWTFPTQPYPEAHFATYPEKLVEICVKAASKEGDIVLDPFAGSGTTLKVAAELNRRAIGYELSEEYCDLTVERNKQGVMV